MTDDRTFDPATMVAWVDDEQDLDHLLTMLPAADEVVFDLETTGLDEHATRGGRTNGGVAARIVLASFTVPNDEDGGQPTSYVVPLSHPDSPWHLTWRTVTTRIAETLRDAHSALIGQNVKFDTRWVLAATGVDLSHLIAWDTRISSHLLDENRRTALKTRAPETFDIEAWDDHDLTYPGAAEDVPLIDLGIYAAQDTYWTWRLAEAHREAMNLGPGAEPPYSEEDVENARLGRLAVWCAMPMVASLGLVEGRGMALDSGWVRETVTEHEEDLAKITASLAGRYDLDPADASFAPTSTWFQQWAERAVEEGDLQIAELTPTGKPRWSKGVLTRQAAESEVADDLLQLRGLTKRLEYLRSWLEIVTPAERVHTTYNAGSVVTGRLSSVSPNMQQVTYALKPAFVPSPEHVFLELDYSQIELRVAAFLSRSQPMIEAFQSGADLHTRLAANIVGKAEEDVTKMERQAGKSANFGLLYGMGAYGFKQYAETAYGVALTEEEAVQVHHTYFETWEGLADWHLRCIHRVRTTGQVVSPLGRVRRLPDIWDGNDERVSGAERAAINSPVQGFASDLMQMAAASINGVLPGRPPVEGASLVGTVHDSILIEVPENDWERVARECQSRMVGITEVLPRFEVDFDVPLKAEGAVGTRWGTADIGEI